MTTLVTYSEQRIWTISCRLGLEKHQFFVQLDHNRTVKIVMIGHGFCHSTKAYTYTLKWLSNLQMRITPFLKNLFGLVYLRVNRSLIEKYFSLIVSSRLDKDILRFFLYEPALKLPNFKRALLTIEFYQ